MSYRLQLQSGAFVGPSFGAYVFAFNYRADHNLVGARIIEGDKPVERELDDVDFDEESEANADASYGEF